MINPTRYNNSNNKNTHQTLKAVLLLSAAFLLLPACGGGGGSSNTDLPIAILSTASANEGNTGSSNLDFTVVLDKVSDVDISVAYTTSDDSAIAGEDYTVTTGTLTIPANSISGVISVPIIGDTNIEADENFNLEISNAQNATITSSTQIVSGNIINDDAALPVATLSASSKSEGDIGSSNLDFTVALDRTSDVDISVAYITSDDSATAGEDYTVTTGTLTIPANSISGVISVPIIGDTNIEIDENFNLEISNAQNATISNNTQSVIGSILSDDTLAGYYTGSASVNEGGGTLTINAGDIRVIADAGTLAITDLNTNLIYIVTLSDISNTDFTANARIYKDGDFASSTNITGTFTLGASISLTLTGTGDYTTGTIALTYSAKNAVAPLVFADGDSWQDDVPGPITAGMAFNSNINADIGTTGNISSSALEDCNADAVDLITVLSEQSGRIRSFAALAASCTQASINSTIINGYITTYDETAADDRILFIWFNNEGAHAAGLID